MISEVLEEALLFYSLQKNPISIKAQKYFIRMWIQPAMDFPMALRIFMPKHLLIRPTEANGIYTVSILMMWLIMPALQVSTGNLREEEVTSYLCLPILLC